MVKIQVYSFEINCFYITINFPLIRMWIDSQYISLIIYGMHYPVKSAQILDE